MTGILKYPPPFSLIVVGIVHLIPLSGVLGAERLRRVIVADVMAAVFLMVGFAGYIFGEPRKSGRPPFIMPMCSRRTRHSVSFHLYKPINSGRSA